MKTIIRKDYALDLMSSLNSLRTKIGDIPKIFFDKERVDKLSHTERVGFDVNRFLKIFDKIQLKEGYILDYAYHFGGLGGEPLIYARKKDNPRLTASEYMEKYGSSDTRPYLNDITIENNPKSFFQIAVFSQVAHQFYLAWHANYNDQQFIFSLELAEDLLKQIPEEDTDNYGITKENREKMRNTLYDPVIDIKEEGAEVICVMFSAWIGFYYKIFFITWPDITIKERKEVIVPYNCGIRF